MPRLSVVAFVLERDSVEPWTTFAAAYLPTHNIISAATTEEFLVWVLVLNRGRVVHHYSLI